MFGFFGYHFPAVPLLRYLSSVMPVDSKRKREPKAKYSSAPLKGPERGRRPRDLCE